MRKRITCFFMLFLIMGITTISHAQSKTDFTQESKYAILFLEDMGFGHNDLNNPIPLNNLDGQLEAVSFTINEVGYIIVNVHDLDIPEFSLKTKSPFVDKNEEYLYNGPLNYLKKTNEKIYDIKSNKVIDNSKLNTIYKKPAVDKDKKIEEKEKKIKNKEKAAKESQVSPMAVIYGNLNDSPYTPLRTWSTSHYCNVDGCAILLQYFDDNYSDSWVPNDKESATGLVEYLLDNLYLLDEPESGYEIVNGAIPYSTGLKDYINDRGFGGTYSATTASYSWDTIKSKIYNHKPVLVGANSSHPDFGAHWIIAHGYYKNTSDPDLPQYIICNNGFGSNDVYTTAESQYYTWGLVYIY